uniref:Citramalyl-CoA lyase, mitochondrial n=1 Tax=Lepeophtheirus salmonis TaxID=72036 RepID=A0A0K2UM41_LEPSM
MNVESKRIRLTLNNKSIEEQHIFNSESNAHEFPMNDFMCPSCDKELTDHQALEAHLSLYCTTSVTNVSDENVVASLMVPTEEQSSKCVFCSMTLESRNELVDHAATHLRCHICLTSKHNFKGLNDMRAHFEKKHDHFPCLWCHFIFETKSSLTKHFREIHLDFYKHLKYPGEPMPLILESILKDNALKLTSIFRAIETNYPYLYLIEKKRDWKREIVCELYSNSRYANTMGDRSHSETLFYIENMEEIVVIGDDNLICKDMTSPVDSVKRRDASKAYVPNHILQLIYEDEDMEDMSVESIRQQEGFLRGCNKPLKVYGMCSLCGRLFSDNESLHVHIKYGCKGISDIRNEENKLIMDKAKCPFCNIVFDRFRHLVHHVLSSSCESAPKDSQICVCNYCPMFLSIDELFDHFMSMHMPKNNHNKFFYKRVCKLCQNCCQNESDLRTHFTSYHLGEIWTCCVCQLQFLSMDLYDKHLTSIHPIQALSLDSSEYSCSVCQVMFNTQEDQDLHLSTTTEHPVCWVCHFPCQTWNELLAHFNTDCIDHSPFYCRDCNKLFHKSRFKSLHVNFQHSKGFLDAKKKRILVLNISPLKCIIDHSSDLSIKFHSKGTKCKACSKETALYECSICYYPVHSLQELHIHLEKANHKDLTCLHCLKRFLTPKELILHYYDFLSHIPNNTQLLITSDEENPNEESEDYPSNELVSLTPKLDLACSKCIKSTVLQNRVDLLTHSLSFHSEIFNKVACDSCGMLFTSKRLLRKHNEVLYMLALHNALLKKYSGHIKSSVCLFSSSLDKRHSTPRRALMYVPGSDKRKLAKIPQLGADCICLDMEDGVSYVAKGEARQLIRNILDGKLEIDFGQSERSIRFNSVQSGLLEKDAEVIFRGDLRSLPSSVQLPKVDDSEHVKWFSEVIKSNVENKILLEGKKMSLLFFVESALALINLNDIVKGILQIKDAPFFPEAIVFGSDDYIANVGGTRTPEAAELIYARQKVVAVAKAYGLQAIDLVHINYKDLEGLKAQSIEGVHMGFSGKQVIHPGQVATVHSCFSPSEEKVRWATELIQEFKVHERSGKGAFTFRGNMIDMPLVLQAQNVLDLNQGTTY